MPGLEPEREIERSKTAARWFAIAFLAWVLWWQRSKGLYPELTNVRLAELVGGAIVLNLAHSLFLARPRECHPLYKFASVSADVLFVSAAIRYTGGSQSPFFFVYFVLLISNCIRYGLPMSIYIAALVNVCYTVSLWLSPPVASGVLGGEGLKILAFWAVALYGGIVSTHLRRQAFEITTYEDTIAELRARLRDLEEGGADAESANAGPA